MAYSPLLDPNAAFTNSLVGNNPMSFSLADYMGGSPTQLSGIAGGLGAGGYNPSSFVGDVGSMSMAAPASLWDQMGTKDFWLGSFNQQTGQRSMGAGGLALGAAQGLMNGWLGMQQLDMAKQQFGFQKDAFAKNWGAQKNTTNAQLRDRQEARLASRQGASTNPYQSVGDYMNQNGIA